MLDPSQRSSPAHLLVRCQQAKDEIFNQFPHKAEMTSVEMSQHQPHVEGKKSNSEVAAILFIMSIVYCFVACFLMELSRVIFSSPPCVKVFMNILMMVKQDTVLENVVS